MPAGSVLMTDSSIDELFLEALPVRANQGGEEFAP